MKFTPTLRLTSAYLAIIMIISVTFSVAVYEISVNALQDGFMRQSRMLEDDFGRGPLSFHPQLDRLRLEQIEETKSDIAINLTIINILILVLGGLGSYFLAQRNLRPIEEALEAQTRFTADASHELRTPLTAMMTEIEVALRDKKLNLNEAKKLLESNLEEIDKLRSLSDGLLTLSRHQNGEKIEFAEVSLTEIAQDAVKKLEPIISSTKSQVKVSGDSNLIKGDRESLVSLLMIFIENAIKYSDGPAKVKIEISQSKKGSQIKISDKGIGIKASDLAHIFERFYRADTSRSKDVDGYGLGLSIASQIIEMHEATISSSSEPGKGTTFIIRF